MNNKKIFIIAGTGLAILIVIIVVLRLLTVTKKNNNQTIQFIDNSNNTFTGNTSPLSQKQTEDLQTLADQKYGKWQQDIITNYSWYNKFPIRTETYYVYFDINKKSFIATLYNRDMPTLKTDVTNTIQSQGVDTNKYPIIFEYVKGENILNPQDEK